MDFDFVIIGAGIVGLAIASELSVKQKSVLVLEQYPSFGQETSSRNSEVIHAGMYYPTNSLKARLCVEGNRLLYDWCERLKVPYKMLGKFIIAIEQEDEASLMNLYEQGLENNVAGLEILSKQEFSKIEPNIKAELALYSPSTGIVDSHSLMQSLETRATNNGVTLAYNHNVLGIEHLGDSYKITVKTGNEVFNFTSRCIINSAGLNSDKIAEMAGINLDQAKYKLSYAKGHYYRLATSKNFIAKHLIYPAPQKYWTGIGIHITHDLADSIKFGPDIQYMDGNILDYRFEGDLKEKFYESVRRYVPLIELEDLVPDQVGIRPKLQRQGEKFRDFVICEESDRGLPNLWNLIGIESPGLTASLSIAKYITSQF
jgi:L-2-hydroxyglutarate oxidase LhgO